MRKTSPSQPLWKARVLGHFRWHLAGTPFLIVLCLAPGLGYSQSDIAQQAGTLMEEGRFHEAEGLWRELTESNPRNASAHANLGLALARQGQLPSAAVEYRKSLAIQPNQPAISFDLGLAEFKQGHFAKAIPPFKSANKAERKRSSDTRFSGDVLLWLASVWGCYSLPRKG